MQLYSSPTAPLSNLAGLCISCRTSSKVMCLCELLPRKQSGQNCANFLSKISVAHVRKRLKGIVFDPIKMHFFSDVLMSSSHPTTYQLICMEKEKNENKKHTFSCSITGLWKKKVNQSLLLELIQWFDSLPFCVCTFYWQKIWTS